MESRVQALFQCNEVLERKAPDGSTEAQIVKFSAVYENNPDHPNYAFWKATPVGSMEMIISNPSAFGAFARGRKFLLTFESVRD